MTESEILRIWNGPTSQCNRAKILRFAADLESRLHAEWMAQQEPLTLPYIVEYARKDGGHSWKPMAAFDFETVAERYAADCANETWEYRVVAAPVAKPAAQELDAIDAASKELK